MTADPVCDCMHAPCGHDELRARGLPIGDLSCRELCGRVRDQSAHHLEAWRESIDPRTESVLLVGEDNPVSSDPRHALWCDPPSCAGWRLCHKILGLQPKLYLSIWRTNLCSFSWRWSEARDRALELAQADHPWKLLLLLGRKVAQAFAPWTDGVPLETWEERPLCDDGVLTGVTLVSLPHPSGRCREWNDTGAVARALRSLRHLAPQVPWGDES